MGVRLARRSLAAATIASTAVAASAADFEAGLAAYRQGDYERALAEWLPLAEQGEPSAQANVAVLYWRGLGVEQDHVLAARWFRHAAEQGSPIAQDGLGQMYFQGQGVERDEEKAAYWIRRAALQGDAPAQMRLGSLYAEGSGVGWDPEKAVRWWRRSADQQNASAQLRLGGAHENGFGVEVDLAQAAHYYELAARQGDEEGAQRLARLRGAGVEVTGSASPSTAVEPEDDPGPVSSAAPPPPESPPPPARPESPPVSPAAPPPPVSPPAPSPADVVVQLAAYRSEARARSAWTELRRTHPQLLEKLGSRVVRADLGERGVYYRLQAGPFSDRSAASALCERLRERSQGCLVR